MYKWGFFILLTVNGLLFAKGLWEKPNVNQRSFYGEKQRERSLRKGQKNNHYRHDPGTRKVKRISLSKSSQKKIALLIEEVKEGLLKDKEEHIESCYQFFFKHSPFTPDQLYQIKLAMIQANHGTMQCFPDEDDNLLEESLIKILGDEGKDQALKMMEQESVYYTLNTYLFQDLDEIENVSGMVDEINDWIQEQRKENDEEGLLAGMGIGGLDYGPFTTDPPVDEESFDDDDPFEDDDDPFEDDDDPFEDDDEVSFEDDDEPYEEEIVVNEQVYAKALSKAKGENLERYNKMISIFEKYTELSIEKKYFLLVNMTLNE